MCHVGHVSFHLPAYPCHMGPWDHSSMEALLLVFLRVRGVTASLRGANILTFLAALHAVLCML